MSSNFYLIKKQIISGVYYLYVCNSNRLNKGKFKLYTIYRNKCNIKCYDFKTIGMFKTFYTYKWLIDDFELEPIYICCKPAKYACKTNYHNSL